MKPIVIAGNGPSLAEIDYSRLPRDFDLFRCNQFYFEDRYFLGKTIKGVFFNPYVLKEQFFTLHHLKQRGEYTAEDVYCIITMGLWDRQNSDGKAKNLDDVLRYDFPSVKNTYPYLEKMQDFHALYKFHTLYYHKRFTAGVLMLVTALAQGYKEIYLTGIDFYEKGQFSYAFDMQNKENLTHKIPTFKQDDFQDEVHQKSVDVEAIKLALSIPDVKLYAISPKSALSEILPLAPILKEHYSLEIAPKPKGYIDDLMKLPYNKKNHLPPPPPPQEKNSWKIFQKIFNVI